MSKELTPLEALNKIAYCYGFDENITIIETALKDYENLKLKHRSMQDAVLEDFKKLKALEIIKELFDFDFAIRFGNNQPMLKIMNKRTGEYWELPISIEKWNTLKEELLNGR